jgi:hypothetical protein
MLHTFVVEGAPATMGAITFVSASTQAPNGGQHMILQKAVRKVVSLRKESRKAVRRLLRTRTWWGGAKGVVQIAVGDYDQYRRQQNEGNLRKLDQVFVTRNNIDYLAAYISSRLGTDELRILCHGTRNGTELRFFQSALPSATLLGTEIADTATQFPNTVQWDFHDMKDEWVGAWDVVYSNSWDHAFDPRRAFLNWMRSLKPQGVLLLDHTRRHTPAHVTRLDPFGARLPDLVHMLNEVGTPRWGVVEVLSDLPEPALGLRTVVVAARPDRA